MFEDLAILIATHFSVLIFREKHMAKKITDARFKSKSTNWKYK
jgi:hypothetical protein